MCNQNRICINKLDYFIISLFAVAYIGIALSRNIAVEILIAAIFLFLAMINIKADTLLKYFVFLVFLNATYINFIIIWIVFLHKLTENPKIFRINKGVSSFACLFLGITFVSGTYSDFTTSTAKEIITWVYVLGVVFCCQYSEDLQGIFNSFVASCLMVSIFWMVNVVYPGLLDNVATIHIPDNNNSSMLLLCGIFICRYLQEEIKGRFIIISFKELMFLIGLLIIGSRGIQILAILYYFFVLFRSIKYKKSAAGLFLIIPMFCVFLLSEKRGLLLDSINRLFSSITDTGFYSNRVRLEVYHNILTKILPGNMLTGIGPGNFMSVYQEYATGFMPNHAHSIYLQILVEDGILGLLILLSFIIYLTCLYLRKMRTANKKLAVCMLWFVGIFWGYGIVEYVWNNANVLAIFMSITVVSERCLKKMERILVK